MSTKAGFLQSLREEPEDDVTRLIFDDWLADHNDPLGEFLRVQTALAQGVPELEERATLHRRSAELLAAHRDTWLGDLAGLCEWIEWHRGLAHLTISGTTLLRDDVRTRWVDLIRAAPVGAVRVIGLPSHLHDAFVRSPLFAGMPNWILNGLDLSDASARLLFSNPSLVGVRRLALANNQLGDASVERLLESPLVDSLVELDLRNNGLQSASVRALTLGKTEARLRELRLQGNPLGLSGDYLLPAWRRERCRNTHGRRRVVNSLDMDFVWIEPGTFLRGSPEYEEGRYDDEAPRQRVRLSRGFYLAAFQVTQADYQRVIGTNPARYHADNGGGPNHPVEMVSWEEANAFCDRLSELLEERLAGHRYRLPSEAEWEWAARCGWDHTPLPHQRVLTPWLANFNNMFVHPVAVGSYPPTPWGIYDQSGNLWDWCADWYAEYPPDTGELLIDPTGPETGTQRVLRGGSWYGPARNCRSACRGSDSAQTHDHYYGFRLVLERDAD